ncbi:MAG: hypothetical protein AVDCRST_MAG87-468 [uncultured Thermomicrobiales bacterium]|uniref:Ppx/GppA phosphatase N-terminal domain-containing protein n=1 Tax=uncultured Thermomicrobiales bacterium TaxID=1645740 RepID=A0A6J4UFG4_9BACT|nr:MAG: hypothetical protein AVDCRST_MAG87-468 [uncultured Thermomicrobiales bacterium]
MVGAVDVGSNSIKLTVARPGLSGGIEELASAVAAVRLGAGLSTSGRLADDRIEAALGALHNFAALAREHGADRLVGVATEATRRAANGATFLERVRAETGWEVRAITGDEEADLTFRGVALNGDMHGRVVIADIGGASTELIVAEGGVVIMAQSVVVGSGTLTDTLVPSDPPTVAELAASARAAAARLDLIAVPTEAAVRLLCVGGTAEYLARLAGGGPVVDRAGIARALDICRARASMELALTLAIPQARARVLPAGIAVIRALADLLHCDQVEVAPSGIRTALLLDTFAEIAARNGAPAAARAAVRSATPSPRMEGMT